MHHHNLGKRQRRSSCLLMEPGRATVSCKLPPTAASGLNTASATHERTGKSTCVSTWHVPGRHATSHWQWQCNFSFTFSVDPALTVNRPELFSCYGIPLYLTRKRQVRQGRRDIAPGCRHRMKCDPTRVTSESFPPHCLELAHLALSFPFPFSLASHSDNCWYSRHHVAVVRSFIYIQL
jgi:hypothetical protein